MKLIKEAKNLLAIILLLLLTGCGLGNIFSKAVEEYVMKVESSKSRQIADFGLALIFGKKSLYEKGDSTYLNILDSLKLTRYPDEVYYNDYIKKYYKYIEAKIDSASIILKTNNKELRVYYVYEANGNNYNPVLRFEDEQSLFLENIITDYSLMIRYKFSLKGYIGESDDQITILKERYYFKLTYANDKLVDAKFERE